MIGGNFTREQNDEWTLRERGREGETKTDREIDR